MCPSLLNKSSLVLLLAQIVGATALTAAVAKADGFPAALAPPVAPTAVTAWLKTESVVAKSSKANGPGVVALSPVPLVVVTTRADELDAVGTAGQGTSLREALRDVDAGGTVQFDPLVFTGASSVANTISLSLGEFRLNKSFTVDATGVSAPVVIQANGASRHFTVYPGKTVVLKRLTLLGGNVSADPNFKEGGALYNSGSLSLADCRVVGNVAGTYGGGIFSYGVSGNAGVSLVRCVVEGNSVRFNGAGIMNWADRGYNATLTVEGSTISGNVTTENGVSSGGAVMNYSTNGIASLTLRRSTLQGNVAASGAGVMNGPNHLNASAVVTLEQATISQNTPSNGTGSAAGLRSYVYSGSALMTLANTILAGNIATTWNDLYVDGGTITSLGGNVIGINHDVVVLASDHFGSEELPLAPNLAPLGDYGGTTRTMALLQGSVAHNGGVTLGAGPMLDQRGYGIQGLPDAGAYEAGNLQDYAGWITERLPAGTAGAQSAAGADFDGDGVSNSEEWLADTSPSNAGSFFQANIRPVPGALEVYFQSALGRNYLLKASGSLENGSWIPEGSPLIGNGQVMSFSVNPEAATRRFYRVDVGL